MDFGNDIGCVVVKMGHDDYPPARILAARVGEALERLRAWQGTTRYAGGTGR